jgi:glycosyltransferase involved in cell wall biosynthesis
MSCPIGDVSGLRVAHLIESDGPGGAERVVVELARTLEAAGARNVAFLPANGEGWLARELEGSGVAIEHFPMHRRFTPALARSLAAAFCRYGITVAHSHEFFMALYGGWASRLARIPHVITMHGGLYYAARLRRRLALRAAATLSARTVAVSRPLAARIGLDLWMQPQRIVTIPNGVRYAPPERVTLRAELQLAPEDRLLLSVGNLYPVKGHQHLVSALGILAARHRRLHVAIAGRGDAAEALAAAARECGVADRLHLLGLRSDIPALHAGADIFVLPSMSEGLPLALLEAMFAGCPIVASDVGEVGVALAHGEAGVLVAPGDPTALAAAIDGLLSNPSLARELGGRAARRAAAEYDVLQMVRRYVGLYEDVVSQLPRRVSRAARPDLAQRPPLMTDER